ncbi:MAG TPA: BamA/TamA family outer membrane protein [Saprospiraceae bacterium]|nr:BamA/TamA family outer membrane protein [Saprospiraceae bacterium]
MNSLLFQYRLSFICIVLLISLFMNSCRSTKFLNEDEFLIKEVNIKIDDTAEKVNKSALKTELNYFVRQQKNGKILFIPREYIFYKTSEPGDSSKVNNWIRSRFGEKPSIHDSLKTIESAKAMEQYLRYKKGFYDATASHEINNGKHKAKITYNIVTGRRYKLGSLTYFSKDTTLLRHVVSVASQSLLTPGEGLDADRFELEKARIVNYLQNQGYADFAANYISVKGDSTSGNFSVDVIMDILLPDGKTKHPVYRNGNIAVYTDHYHKQDTSDMLTQRIDSVLYKSEQSYFMVSPKVISNSISFEPGGLTRRDDRIYTYNKLANLGAYRFAEIIPSKNQQDSLLIDYNIQLTPYINKWTMDNGLDVFNSTLAGSGSETQRLLGFGVSTQLTNRNLLGGSERYSISGGISTQIDLSQSANRFRAFNVNFNNDLQFPTFKDPLKAVKALNKVYLASDKLYGNFVKDAVTNLNLGFNLVNLRDLYSITTVNASLGYRFTDRISRSIIIDQIGITFNNYTIKSLFDSITIKNPFIKRNFEDNFFTGLFFRNLNYTFNFPRNEKGWSGALFTNIEFSGLEAFILNGISNSISGKDQQWSLGGYEFSKFGRLELDGRITKSFSGKRSLVGRLNFGIIAPLVKNQAAPFIKQFNVGGPNSLRAWGPRVLGPGAFFNPTLGNVLPYSQGDLKIEANLEYRFNIWWILQGAVFVDAGNVWALTGFEDENGNFGPDFLNQVAVAAGWGMRWDFNYFNIRFDFGYRMRDPFITGKSHWYSLNRVKEQNLGNIQVAVNYPF